MTFVFRHAVVLQGLGPFFLGGGSAVLDVRASPNLAPAPQATIVEIVAQTLDLGRAHVTAKDGWSRVEPEALGWSNLKTTWRRACLIISCLDQDVRGCFIRDS